MLCIEGISKRYGNKEILNNVSLSAQKGECVAVVGRNGSGKTTLIEILAGCIKPDSGSVSFYGKDPLKDHKYFSKMCGFVPQESPLFEDMSVADNLMLAGFKKNASSKEFLCKYDLEEVMSKKVSKLSGGMKRRLAIAMAMVNDQPILLLDEPTTSLDIFYQESIRNFLDDYRKSGGIVVMATHSEEEILIADKVYVLSDGKLSEINKDGDMMSTIKNTI